MLHWTVSLFRSVSLVREFLAQIILGKGGRSLPIENFLLL